MRSVLASWMVPAAVIAAGASLPTANGADELQVLFIGNSYAHLTSGAFEGFADADPNTNLTIGLAVMGGQWLSWHYANREKDVYGLGTTLVEMLRSKDWNAVVLQEFSTGPTRYGNLPSFMQASYDLAGLIRTECGAEVWFYETWARRADNTEFYPTKFTGPTEMQAELRVNYGNASASVNGKVAPIGDAWELAYYYRPFDPNNPNSFTLHEWDTTHPNDHGKYLTGAVLYQSLLGRNPIGSGYRGSVTPEDALFLQRIASLTNAGFKDARRGDLNCDKTVDFGDVTPFVLALSDQQEYEKTYPACTVLNGDCNSDGRVDFGDINAFVELLQG